MELELGREAGKSEVHPCSSAPQPVLSHRDTSRSHAERLPHSLLLTSEFIPPVCAKPLFVI
jgi:hypothetical protein